jgi:hypothetical protein
LSPSPTISASGRRRGDGGLALDLLHHIDQHLGRAQIGARRLVDYLRDDRLALGDPARRPLIDRDGGANAL